MADGVSSRSLKQFNGALQEYLKFNQRETGPLIDNRGKRVQWELYRQFRAIATPKDRIEQEAAQRGYAIRRRMGTDGKRLSVKKELAERKRTVGYLSLSFLHRTWKAKREGQSSQYTAKSRRNRRIGEALVRTAKGKRKPFVRLTSLLAGAVKQNRQRRIVDKALKAQASDMKTYVQRKQREALKRSIAKPFS